MNESIRDTVIATLLAGSISFFAPFIYIYFFDNTPRANIGKSVQINEGQVFTPINLITYDKSIEELRISLPIKIKGEQLRSNTPINFSIMESDIQTVNGTDISFTEIAAKKEIQMGVITATPLFEEDISITRPNGGIKVSSLSEVDNPALLNLKNLLLNALMYSLLFGISTYYTYRSKEKSDEKFNERMEVTKQKLDYSEKELNRISDDIDKHKNDNVKMRLLLLSKLHDYRKELNFWRNTIRKVLYQNKYDKKQADDLVNLVTSTLKTYQTNSKDEHDFEHLKMMASYIKEKEKEE